MRVGEVCQRLTSSTIFCAWFPRISRQTNSALSGPSPKLSGRFINADRPCGFTAEKVAKTFPALFMIFNLCSNGGSVCSFTTQFTVSFRLAKRKLTVNWVVNEQTLPPFEHRLKIMNKAGKVLATFSAVKPHGRSALINLPESLGDGPLNAELVCLDILGNQAQKMVLEVRR